MLRMAVVSVLMSGAFISPASAQETNIPKVNVTFPTRQLRDAAEAKAVYARLYSAVQYVCQTDGGKGPLWRLAYDRACEGGQERHPEAAKPAAASGALQAGRPSDGPGRKKAPASVTAPEAGSALAFRHRPLAKPVLSL